jgi:hypothetical protein
MDAIAFHLGEGSWNLGSRLEHRGNVRSTAHKSELTKAPS